MKKSKVKLVHGHNCLLTAIGLPERCAIQKKSSGWLLKANGRRDFHFRLHPDLLYFYHDERVSTAGLPLAGALHRDDRFEGSGRISCFDVTEGGLNHGIMLDPGIDGNWVITRAGKEITLMAQAQQLSLNLYQGNEPDWKAHSFPFRNLPAGDPRRHHAMVRGLLDFFGGTRGTLTCDNIMQKPNTNAGYGMDGIVDTYFQFLGAYPYISNLRRSYLESQIKWLGRHIRFDGCIPWGRVATGEPYYHLWVNPKYGLFFDGNALWLDMVYQIWKTTGNLPDLGTILRASDFYLHYMTSDGLVAAESKMKGCEWADLLKNGWHSSLVNVLAYRGLVVTAVILRAKGEKELANRYQGHARRLRSQLNRPLSEGGLWTGNGYVDWRGPKGDVHPHYRIDTHALALLFQVPEHNQADAIVRTFEAHPLPRAIPPAPYLLIGNWSDPADDMLEGCRAWDCGLATMCGRCGGTLTAALAHYGKSGMSRALMKRLIDMVVAEKGIPEQYHPNGKPKMEEAFSYIEHSLSVCIAWTLMSPKPSDA